MEGANPRVTESITMGKVARPPELVTLRVKVVVIPSRVADIVKPVLPLCRAEVTQEEARASSRMVVIVKIPPNMTACTVVAHRSHPTRDLGRALGRNSGMIGEKESPDRRKTRKNGFAISEIPTRHVSVTTAGLSAENLTNPSARKVIPLFVNSSGLPNWFCADFTMG